MLTSNEGRTISHDVSQPGRKNQLVSRSELNDNDLKTPFGDLGLLAITGGKILLKQDKKFKSSQGMQFIRKSHFSANIVAFWAHVRHGFAYLYNKIEI